MSSNKNWIFVSGSLNIFSREFRTMLRRSGATIYTYYIWTHRGRVVLFHDFTRVYRWVMKAWGGTQLHRKIHKVIKCAESEIVRTAQISYENIKGAVEGRKDRWGGGERVGKRVMSVMRVVERAQLFQLTLLPSPFQMTRRLFFTRRAFQKARQHSSLRRYFPQMLIELPPNADHTFFIKAKRKGK